MQDGRGTGAWEDVFLVGEIAVPRAATIPKATDEEQRLAWRGEMPDSRLREGFAHA
jgi:hypothetical protein